jgi:DNA-binding CsgD family transcriptional regulator
MDPTAAASEVPSLNQLWLQRRSFVGRSDELRRLQALFEAAAAGQGSMIMVVGEPGIGKTALCEELATIAVSRGGRALVGLCYEDASFGLPYQPFVDAIASYVRLCDPDLLRQELGTAIGEIARLVPAVRDGFQVELELRADPADDRFRLMNGVLEFLRNMSATQPLLLTLEDLHDADRGTLDLLVYIARHLEDARLLVVGTYRDVEVERTHPLSAALSELRRSSRYERLHLRGLTVDGVHQLLASTAQQTIPQPLAELLHRRTDGNPLFVHEMLRYVLESGLVERRDGALRRVGEETLAGRIPEGLRDVVGKRLSRLSSTANDVLSTAAVIGREFPLETLQKVHAGTEHDIVAALEEAVEAGIIEERSIVGGTVMYQFTHAFIRQTLYEEMIAPRRLRLHREVAHALEHVYARRLEEHSGELAEHYAFSTDTGDLEKAVQYGQLAARRAVYVFAHGEAVRLIERVLQIQGLIDPADIAKRCDLLLALGEALFPCGETSRALQIAPEAFSLAEKLEDSSRASRACRLAIDSLEAQSALTAAGRDEYLQWAERATHYAASGTAERVHADLAMAHAMYVRGHTAEARGLRLGALAAARDIKDPEALFKAAFFVLTVGPLRSWDEARQLADEAASWSRDGVSSRAQSLVLWNAGFVHLARGNRHRAEALWSEVEDLAERTHGPTAMLFSHCSAAILALVDGRLDESVLHLDRFLRQSEESGAAVRGREFSLQAQFVPLMLLGRGEEWLLALQEYVRIEGAAMTLQALPPYHALCLAQLGRLEEARALVGEQLDVEASITDANERATAALTMLLETAVLLGHRAAAAALSSRLADMADLLSTTWYPTSIARHLGEAAVLIGDRPAAHAYYAQALESAAKIRFRPEIALTHLQLAELMLQESNSTDRAEVHNHLDLAIAEFRAMKMPLALERATRLIPDQRATRRSGRPILTAREREIAELIALGRSNREIASTLVISEGTVEVHAKHILSKLGFRSRAQVGAWLASQ